MVGNIVDSHKLKLTVHWDGTGWVWYHSTEVFNKDRDKGVLFLENPTFAHPKRAL